MATADVLQTPQIIEIIGSTIRVKHPDISGYTNTTVSTPLSAGGTTLTVLDNNYFEDNDWFIIGHPGDNETEDCDVNGAVTRGTSITITNTTSFDHEIDSPVTKIFERGIKIYGATTDGGAGTLIASVDAKTASGRQLADAIMIQWNQQYTEYTMISTDTAYNYYYVTFTDGTTESSASDYVAASGLTNVSVAEMVSAGLNEVNAEIDGTLLTREWLLSVANDFQDEVTNYTLTDEFGNKIPKDWSWELFTNDTSLSITENENSYTLSGLSETLKYSDTPDSILDIRIGTDVLKKRDITQFDYDMRDKVKGVVASAASAGDTTLTLDDTYEFSESGSISVPGQTAVVTYTTNTESTGVLSGIPASGTGAITVTSIALDATVWQGVTPGKPEYYTIYDGNIMFSTPPDSTLAGKKIKVRGLKKISRLSSFSDSTVIPFTYLAKYYIGSRIESKKGNSDNSNNLYSIFLSKLQDQAIRDGLPVLDQLEYRKFNWDSESTIWNTYNGDND